MFLGIAIGIAAATLGIIVAEIVADYSLGDKIKDLFTSAQFLTANQLSRAESRYKAALAKVQKELKGIAS